LDATNSWSVSGEHTESGLPMIVNDPHLENVVPSHFYPTKVNYTYPNGTSSLSYGISVPGSPQLFGKTPYYASGFSVSYGDSQDLYREKI
jgi:penicillin amidase